MAFQVDLSGHKPYKLMGQSCRLKDIREFRVNWPKLVTADELAHANLLMRYMRKNDIDEVVELWKKMYPEAYGSTHQFVFDSEWYADNVLLEETWEKDRNKKNYAIILLEDLTERKVGAILLMTKWDQNLQVELTMGGSLSSFRHKKTFFPLFENMLNSIEKTEAELVTVFAETWHKKTQELMDHYGFKIWGIFPGQMIRWSGDQKCYRACEVHYYKFINGGERFATGPDEWVLSDKSNEVWQVLKKVND